MTRLLAWQNQLMASVHELYEAHGEEAPEVWGQQSDHPPVDDGGLRSKGLVSNLFGLETLAGQVDVQIQSVEADGSSSEMTKGHGWSWWNPKPVRAAQCG